MQDEKGYYLLLAGDAWNRTIETVKFYLALTRAGVPVYLEEARTPVARMTEEEKIGSVPGQMMPSGISTSISSASTAQRTPQKRFCVFLGLS